MNDLTAFLDADQAHDLLRFLTAGSVDDGKSTLIGRLLVDSKKLYDDQIETLIRESRRRGEDDELAYALLLDGLRAEREQGITIDVAYRYFATPRRKFIIADTPGHEQYTRNMITGGSTASAAVLLIDAQNGITAQTRRHTRLIHLLGIRHLLLAINKMDLVGYAQALYEALVEDFEAFAAPFALSTTCIPLSARYGDNVVSPSPRMPWYCGATLLSYLETVPIERDYNLDDVRFPVQYVLRHEGLRGLCGTVAGGVLRKGMTIVALPSRRQTHIKSIITYDGERDEAFPPQAVMVTLTDALDISRGDMLVCGDSLPHIGRAVKATMVWMDEEPMDVKKMYYLKHTTSVCRAFLAPATPPLHLNDIDSITLFTAKEIFFDAYDTNRATGAFILIDPLTHHTCAAGMIIGAASDAAAPAARPFTISLPALGIAEQHRAAVAAVVDALAQQGVPVILAPPD